MKTKTISHNKISKSQSLSPTSYQENSLLYKVASNFSELWEVVNEMKIFKILYANHCTG